MLNKIIIYEISKTIMNVIFSFKNKIISGSARSATIKRISFFLF